MTQRSIEPESVVGVPPSGDMPFALRIPGVALGRFSRLASRLLLIAAAGLLLVAMALLVFRVAFDDRIYPAVVVGDVEVGGLTVEEAIAQVEGRAADLERGTFTFTYNGQTWTPTLQEIGASIDTSSSVEAAYVLGRDTSAVERLGFAGDLLKSDQVVPLRTTVDRNVLDQWFDQVDEELGQRAADATLTIDDGGTALIVPERSGVVVDRDAASTNILDSLQTLKPLVADLPTMVEQPSIAAADLEDERTSLHQSLSTPIVLTFEQRKWDIAPADLVPFIVVDQQTGGHVEVSLDQDALTPWLRERFSAEIDRTPVDADIAWKWDEGLVALEPSIDGTTLRANALAAEVESAFVNHTGRVEIPVVRTSPELDSTNLDALKINSKLARGDSNYGGQAWARDTNVEVATDLLSGTLVRPGEEFSFNEAIGKITQEKGYVESGVIINGRASTGDGGGVCQVSTTMFRAAILAGLPITDWEEHTQRLRIYEQDGWTAGYDASILQLHHLPEEQWGDLKFLNDTDGYLLIQAWSDYPYNIVEIYGNDDGRTVDISGASIWEATSYPPDTEVVDPEAGSGTLYQSEWPRLPMETVFTMTVTYADKTVKTQEFYSTYQGSGNVYTVSPDMAGQSPGAG